MSYLFLVSPDVVGIGSEHFVVYLSCVYIYKERAAPPIGGPALHDSGVEIVQWRKREGHDSYQEVEVSIYILRSRQIFVKKLWHCCRVVSGTCIFWQWVVVQLKLEELAKVVVNRHLNPEDCSGMTWAESAEGWKTEGLCLTLV